MAERSSMLDIIQGAISGARGANATAALKESENATKAEALLEQIAQKYEQNAVDAALVARTQQAATAKAQEVSARAVEAGGGYDALYATISQIAKTNQEVLADMERYNSEVASTAGFSPLGALKLSLDWTGNRSKVNQGVAKLKVLESGAQALESRLNQVAQISRNAAQTVTAASAEASANVIAREAEIQAMRARLDGLRYNTAGVTAMAQATDKDLQYLFNLANFKRAEDEFGLRMDQEKRYREQFNWEKERQADEKGFTERTVGFINLARAQRGQSPLTSQDLRDQIRIGGGKLSTEMVELLNLGQMISRDNVGYIATDPAGAAQVLLRDPQLMNQLSEERKKALQIIQAATQQAVADKGRDPKLADDKDGSKLRARINERTNQIISQELARVQTDPKGLFYVGDASSYIGTADAPGIGAFQNYPLVTKILNPAIAAKVPLSDPNVIFQLAVKGVQAGDISSNQAAADFSNMYRRMVAVHQQSLGLKSVGITLPAEGARYKVDIGGTAVDALNFSEVALAMAVELRKAQAKKLGPFGGAPGNPTAGQVEMMSQGVK